MGENKSVWHVIGPGGKNVAGAWYCFDTREEAQEQAARMRRAQVSRGTATLSPLTGELSYWAVQRPEWRDEAA